jgi:hypothetical protein
MDEEIAVRIDAFAMGIELPTTSKTGATYGTYMKPTATADGYAHALNNNGG